MAALSTEFGFLFFRTLEFPAPSGLTLAHMSDAAHPALAQFVRGTSKVLSEQELDEKLKQGRPLRIKFGVDPTAPDIHLGHTVPLEKLRQFQASRCSTEPRLRSFSMEIGFGK